MTDSTNATEKSLPTILWPQMRWPDGRETELNYVQGRAKALFKDRFAEVSKQEWESCDGLISVLDVPQEYRQNLKRCRILVTPKVGFDNIDLQAWGSHGIPVCNVPDYGTMEVADHAIALMLTLVKGIAFHSFALKQEPVKNWRPALNPYGRRLSACTFGVVGLGRIGSATALRAKAFGMKVCFYDPYLPNGWDLALGLKRIDSLEALLAESDVVSLHTPLNEETTNMINRETLAGAKQSLVLINTARGPLVDLDALYDGMKNGKVLAAGLDVLPKEPPSEDHPLIRDWCEGADWLGDRLALTPHSAFFTPESVYDMRVKGIEVILRYLSENRLENCVNLEYLR